MFLGSRILGFDLPSRFVQGLRIVDLYAKKGVDPKRLYIKVRFQSCRTLWQMSLHAAQLRASHSIGPQMSMCAVVDQIASTWEGIRACEVLQKQGIETNMTLLFSFAQVSYISCTYKCVL